MTYKSVQTAYQQSSARGATSLGQVVALYDTILRDFYRAQAAMDARNIEARAFELNHAIIVVGELQNVLDFERGGEAAMRLKSFYEVARTMILEVSVNPSNEGLKRLIEIFLPVRQAWKQISEQLPTEAARDSSETIRVSMSPSMVAPPDESAEAQPAGLWRG
jgi:flagellar protein FliS